MSRVVLIVAVLTTACVGTATGARAQSLRTSPGAPTPEIGLFAGAWNIDGSGMAGVGSRVTVHHSPWLGTEYALEAKSVGPFGPTKGMLIVAERLSLTDATRSGFVMTAGGALGKGYRRTWSPMVGIGVQRLSKGVGTRVDLQYFPGGPVHQRNDARVTFGLVIAPR